MTYTKNGKTYHCPVEAALDVIGGKWKPLILWALGDNVLRFGELQKGLPGVNAKMLTKQLRELEEDGVITRTVYPEVPPRVEYAITDFGKTLIPILQDSATGGHTTSGSRMHLHTSARQRVPGKRDNIHREWERSGGMAVSAAGFFLLPGTRCKPTLYSPVLPTFNRT